VIGRLRLSGMIVAVSLRLLYLLLLQVLRLVLLLGLWVPRTLTRRLTSAIAVSGATLHTPS
jgi:hypothetical protein